MAKNDYFVMAYKLLKYLYDCLKNKRKPNMNYLTHESKYFPVDEDYFDYLIEHLFEDGYIENVIVQYADDSTIIYLDESVRITPKGIEYIQDNRKMRKIARAIKNIGELIP